MSRPPPEAGGGRHSTGRSRGVSPRFNRPDRNTLGLHCIALENGTTCIHHWSLGWVQTTDCKRTSRNTDAMQCHEFLVIKRKHCGDQMMF